MQEPARPEPEPAAPGAPSAPAAAGSAGGAATLGALVTTAGLLAWDGWRLATTQPRVAASEGAATSLAVGGGLLFLGLLAPLLVHAALRVRLVRRGALGAAAMGVLEACALIYLVFYLQDPRGLLPEWRVPIAIGAVLAFAGARVLWTALGRGAQALVGGLVALAMVAVGLRGLLQIRWNGEDWFRLSLHLVIAVGAATLVGGRWGARIRPRLIAVLAGAAALTLLASGPLLSRSPTARLALHHRSSHTAPWLRLATLARDGDGDGATSAFGGLDCDDANAAIRPGATELPGDGIDSNCLGGDGQAEPRPPAARASRGAARGADVLILSVDSLRWDVLDDLAETRAALGPHVTFERAVTTAPSTADALASAARGRALRQVAFEPAERARGAIVWRDPNPTLGHVLVRAGYRAFTVPTNDKADPKLGIQSGFEPVWVANHDAPGGPPRRSPFVTNFVPADEVRRVVLGVAAATPGPLCAWLHLMEPHHPYRLTEPPPCDAAKAPEACFRRAVHETSRNVADLVRDFARVRGRPLVVAVLGDHGEEFGEHGGDFHASSVHAEQARVVFLLAAPGLSAASVDAPVSIAALAPTVIELLGLDVPASMTSPSLLPALSGELPWGTLAVTEVRGARPMTGYTTTTHRYLHDPAHGIELLYRTADDPLEQRDVSRDDPAALDEMRRLARAWDEAH